MNRIGNSKFRTLRPSNGGASRRLCDRRRDQRRPDAVPGALGRGCNRDAPQARWLLARFVAGERLPGTHGEPQEPLQGPLAAFVASATTTTTQEDR